MRARRAHFGSIAAIAAAAPEELCAVEGIGPAQAKVIWDHYHQKVGETHDAGGEAGGV